jgi:hypothetical protein
MKLRICLLILRGLPRIFARTGNCKARLKYKSAAERNRGLSLAAMRAPGPLKKAAEAAFL